MARKVSDVTRDTVLAEVDSVIADCREVARAAVRDNNPAMLSAATNTLMNALRMKALLLGVI